MTITNLIHGHASTYDPSPTYITWNQMMDRCYNVNNKDYPNYGGRGIVVSDEWAEFSTFLNDMGERPQDKTLDRIDNSGNYCKDNCRWATREEQARNRSTTYLTLEIAAQIVLSHKGNRTYSEVAKLFNTTRQQVRHICLGNAWKGAIDLADQLEKELKHG